MSRQTRIEYPGAIHHVMSRGDRRENIFLDDVDRQDFLKTLDEETLSSIETGWCLGSQGFREKMLAWVDGKAGDNVCGALRLEKA